VVVEKWATDYLKNDDALQVTRSDQLRSFFDDMIASMGNLVYVIIGVASLLSVVIIYTLTNINVSERIRELSTLKVLGFYKREVLDYIYRESNILTLLGIIAGIFLGWGLHDYIMTILPPSAASSPMGVSWWTVVRAAVLTFVFGLVVRQLMKRKIDSVDMLEALKSVD
jgi:putative ABC transport system permease protein